MMILTVVLFLSVSMLVDDGDVFDVFSRSCRFHLVFHFLHYCCLSVVVVAVAVAVVDSHFRFDQFESVLLVLFLVVVVVVVVAAEVSSSRPFGLVRRA